MQTIFTLIGEDSSQLSNLLEDLGKLVPYDPSDDGSFSRPLERMCPISRPRADDPYHYELPPQFERCKAIRSSCGYVGLRNLSNTCYLNSLFTQLFMNIEFRRFILGAEVRDELYSQKLLFQTRNLFGFPPG